MKYPTVSYFDGKVLNTDQEPGKLAINDGSSSTDVASSKLTFIANNPFILR